MRSDVDRRAAERDEKAKGSWNVTMPKNLNNEEIEDVPVADDPLLDVAAELVELPAVPVVAAAGPVPGKRALGVKEPIIFKWKLIGTSQNMTLTLFKSVEREEAEAQLDRLQKDGYYTELKILEAETKVEQPLPLKGAKKPSPRTQPSGKSAEKTGPGAEGGRRTVPPPAPSTRRPGAAKPAAKSEARPTKKKTAGAASAPKRVAKKK
ncbi:MAG: hypothetical protein V1790_15575 [Planctomycetota bacterium]